MTPRRPLLIAAAVAGAAVIGWGIVSAVRASTGPADPAVVTTASRNPAVPTTQDLRPAVPGVAEVGATAPAIDLPALSGRGRVTAGGGPGAPTLINFWASWCIPCRREFPMLSDVQRDYGPRGLRVVGVTFNDARGAARRFVRDERATWRMGFDADGGAARDYGVRAAPQTVLVASDGRITRRWFGAPTEPQLRTALDALLAA